MSNGIECMVHTYHSSAKQHSTLAKVLEPRAMLMDAYGQLEEIEAKGDETAGAVGRLLELLYAKGIITLEEATTVVGAEAREIEIVNPKEHTA